MIKGNNMRTNTGNIKINSVKTGGVISGNDRLTKRNNTISSWIDNQLGN